MIGAQAIHYARVVTGIDLPHTQTTVAEREALASLLPGKKLIVEIGVYEGFTTRMLAEASDPDARVFGVDPFYGGRLGICWSKRIACHYNRSYLNDGKLELVCKTSTSVDDDVPTPVDLVFIDGDHSLQAIAADWAYWSQRVRVGGLVALHDTLLTPDKPIGYSLGSIDYFDSHIKCDPEFEIISQQDSLSVLRRLEQS